MKNVTSVATFFLSIALLPALTGCAHKPVAPTPIPHMAPPPAPAPTPPPGPGPGEAVTPSPQPLVTPEPAPVDYGPFTNLFFNPHNEDRDKFKADTIYFDFDSSTIKPEEQAKLQDVANFFKTDNTDALQVEGNCDERGTAKYNLSLGERRAQAVREYLANLGMDPQRVHTLSYGASRPVDPGHNEEAWKKNRRGDIILLIPK